jgi:hypothetical protein
MRRGDWLLAGIGISALTLLGCGNQSTPAGESDGEGGVVLDENDTIPGDISEGDISLNLPAGWVRVVPTNSMRTHQFVVGASNTLGASANGAVFTTIGGSIDSNIARWESQISGDGAGVSYRGTMVGDRHISVFEGEGTFDTGRMMGSTGPRDSWIVWGLIIETTTDKPFVLKLDGPADILRLEWEQWDELLASVRVGGEALDLPARDDDASDEAGE